MQEETGAHRCEAMRDSKSDTAPAAYARDHSGATGQRKLLIARITCTRQTHAIISLLLALRRLKSAAIRRI
jgi:hypothetical protein